MKAHVSGVSMRPPLCTDADDLLRCSATVGNLGREGRTRHPYLGKALGSFACAKDRAKHTGPPFNIFKHESILHMFASAGKQTPAA